MMAVVEAGAVEILTVCTHNRTRSVMSMAMLQAGFDEQVGAGSVQVRSLGFGPEGMPPIDDAVDAMRRRGLDVAGHRSRQVTEQRIDRADLILTSEKGHVIRIAALAPGAYRRTFTLPEFCSRILSDPIADGRSLAAWMADLSEARRAVEYLRGDVPEVADPTGSSSREFEALTSELESMCTDVVDVLARSSLSG